MTQSAGMSANQAARIAEINALAALGGSAAEEINHVRNLATRLCASSNPPTPQQGSHPEFPREGAGAAQDPNEPWKTNALRTAMSKIESPATTWTMYEAMKRLTTIANNQCGWVGKKEFMTVLEQEPLKSETQIWYRTSAPPKSSARAQTPPVDPWNAAPAQKPAPASSADKWCTTTSEPTIPTHPWTKTEITTVEGILEAADWPVFDAATTNIYQYAHKGADNVISRDTILSEARLLQLALLISQQKGRFQRLAEVLQKGLQGMETLIMASDHQNQHMEDYYEKTAGDMVQSYWCRKHLSNMSDCFQLNQTQAAIARWLQLAQLVLPCHIADQISTWSEHHVADFQEQLTLYLPTKLLTLYMNVSNNYHRLFVKSATDIQLCEHRNDCGLLSCDKQVRSRYDRFCCHAHFTDTRLRVVEEFKAWEYGPEYLPLKKGDMVKLVEHKEAEGGWSYAVRLDTQKFGWIPTEFAAPHERRLAASL